MSLFYIAEENRISVYSSHPFFFRLSFLKFRFMKLFSFPLLESP